MGKQPHTAYNIMHYHIIDFLEQWPKGNLFNLPVIEQLQ